MSRKVIPDIDLGAGIRRLCTACETHKEPTLFYEYKTGVNKGKRHRRCMECAKKYMRDWWRKNNAGPEADTKGATEVVGESIQGNGTVTEGSVPSETAGGPVVLHSKPEGEGKGIKLDRSRGRSRRKQTEVL